MTFSAHKTEFYELDRFRVEAEKRRLVRKSDESVIPLPPKSFDLLLLFVRSGSRILTKETILESIWRGQFVEENNLTVRISELRKALGEKRGENKFIQTVPGQGYRFVADAQIGEVEKSVQKAAESRESLAVLPFVNETGNAALDYISEGITESVINNLSRLSQIKVISRSVVYNFQENAADLREAGEKLAVRKILTGRLLKAGEHLVLSVELIDLADDSQIWGARFQYQPADLFETQEIIAREVSAGLRLILSEDEAKLLSKRPTQNSQAYHLYLRGRYLWNKRGIKDIKKAAGFFRQAIKKDKKYALAHAGLADCLILLYESGEVAARDAAPTAEQTVLEALKIDDSLAEAHASLAVILGNYKRNWSEAEIEYRRAVELNPEYPAARYRFAMHLTKLGRFDEAFFQIEEARKIDPLSPVINKTKAKMLYLARRYDEAAKVCLELLEIEPNFGPAAGILGLVYIEQGLYDKALRQMRELIKFSAGDYETENLPASLRKHLFLSESDPEAMATVGYIYAKTGKQNEALEIAEGLKELSRIRAVEPHTIALVYTGLKDVDQAIEYLERAYRESASIITFLKVWSLFDSLRPDARFQALLKRIGFDS